MDQLSRLLRRPGLLIGAAAAIVLAIIAPEIYTGTFSDLDTAARVGGVVVLLGAWVVGVKRIVDVPAVRAGLIGIPVAVVLAVLVWPYVRPATEVDEAFPPVVAIAETTISPTSPTAPPTTVPPTTTSQPTTTAPPAGADPTTTTPPAGADPTTTTTTAAPTTTTVPPEPVELRRSSFQGLTGHRGSGDAAVYRLADQSLLLRFEDVDIGSGPALEVYLVPGEDQRGLGGSTYVAPLTAERGNQNYTIPSGVDLTDGTWTVLVWCETFSVEVANATLA
ncbi:MAG: DM13 domain-containing protein [Actinomycetota bacterium]